MLRILISLLLLISSNLIIAQDCEIWDVVAEAQDCDDNGQFKVILSFEYSNVGHEGFNVRGNGHNYGNFEYADVPIMLGPLDGDCETEYEFVVQDNQFPDCKDFTELGKVCCEEEKCEIYDLEVQILECHGDSTMDIQVNFKHKGTKGAGFDVYSRNGYFGYYPYNLPVVILGFPNTGQRFEYIRVCDSDSNDCCAETEFDTDECTECSIYNLVVEAKECDSTKQFYVDLDFEFRNVGDSGFVVFVNHEEYGPYEYDSLAITMGPFQGGCDSNFLFIVEDVENEHCRDSFNLEQPCCEADSCMIWDLEAEALECTSDSTIAVRINFNHKGTSGVGFDVYTRNNRFIGFYSYSDLPLTIRDFPISGHDFEYIRVCDNDNDHCCAETEFEALDCSSEDCEIWDVNIDVGDCDSTGQFYIHISFQYRNTSDSFEIRGNGHNYGTFAYGNLPIRLGSFGGDCETTREFVVIDQENRHCRAESILEPVCCDGEECEIGELHFEVSECDSSGQFYVEIEFDHRGTSDSFELRGNGHNYGTFAYEDLPIRIGPLEGDCETVYEFLVIDKEKDHCRSDGRLEPVCCEEEGCEIWDVNIDVGDCDSTGQFYIHISFQHRNTSDSFEIRGNGHNYGTFAYGNLPIRLGSFGGDCETTREFVVIDQENRHCRAESILEPVCCDGEECEIGELHFEVSECDSSGQFYVEIEFDHRGTSDSFELRGNGHNYGTFAYDDLPIRIGPLEGDCETVYEFLVIDKEKDHCRSDGRLEPVCCEEEGCEIWDINIDVGDCDSTGQFYIHISFQHRNTSDSFEIRGNGHNYGTFAYADLPIRLGPFEGDCETTREFVVIDQENRHCRAEAILEPVCCEEEGCEIWDINIDVGDCDSTGQFYIHISFQHRNTSDSFEIRGNGHNYGTFAYADLPVRLGSFGGDCETTREFVVIDQENRHCRAEAILEPVCCDVEECEIGELHFEVSECDSLGQFYVEIDFDHTGTSDSFELRGNGHNYGTFAYADLPIRIGPLDGDCETVYEFLVIDKEKDHCRSDGRLEPVCCEEEGCEIWDLNIDRGDCDSLGQFYVHLNFQYRNTSDSFEVRGNGHNYGTFAYDDMPVRIGPLDGDCETNYEFVVVDSEDEHCRDEAELGEVCCETDELCAIDELEVTAIECTSDSTMAIKIDFKHKYTGNRGFDVYGRKGFVGTYPYELPIVIDDFPLSEGDFEFIRVCDNDRDDCCSQTEFRSLDCTRLSVEDELSSYVDIRKQLFTLHIMSSLSLNEMQLDVLSIIGQRFSPSSINGTNEIIIDIESLLPGVYVLVLRHEKGIMTYQFVR